MNKLIAVLAILCCSCLHLNLHRANEKENMVFVKGGTFDMGNAREDFYFYKTQKPVHEVKVEDFFIDQFEVTNEEYVKFLNDWSSEFQLDSIDRASTSSLGMRYREDLFIDVLRIPDTTIQSGILYTPSNLGTPFSLIKGKEKFPVTYVTWYGAKGYCEWKHTKGSLPSEAQWEYAARGGVYWKEKRFEYAGSNILDSVGWYWNNAQFKPHQVGLKKPNQLGIYDMSGNLWEWVEDHWHENYDHAPNDDSPWIEPKVRKDYNRGLRGGAWLYSKSQASTTNRWSDVPDDRHDYKGFRCVCRLN